LDGGEPGERAVPAAAFKPDGHWIEAPRLWDPLDPERIVGGRQLWQHVQEAVERLPVGQRAVLTLRDIEGCTAEEVCALLELSPENQRVLLHRARGRIRQAIDSLPGVHAAPAAAHRPGRRSAAVGAVCRTMAAAWRRVRRCRSGCGPVLPRKSVAT
jgi:RNA polymerase sigma-70 factor (ECF subfamily)